MTDISHGTICHITRTTITRTITMATADIHSGITADTVTTADPVMGIVMEAEAVIDTTLAVDQGISEVRGTGNKHGYVL